MTTRTVDIDWKALVRTHPVILTVTDDRTATIQYKRSSTPIIGNDPEDRTGRARRQIAQWASDGGHQALPVTVYDAAKASPLLLVCTTGADFAQDVMASDAERIVAQQEFNEWRAANHLPPSEPKHAEPAKNAPAPVSTRDTPAAVEAAPIPAGSPFQDMEPLMERGKRSQDARLGWRGAANQALHLHLPPGDTERGVRADVATIAQGWTGFRNASVANDKGGAGKTPTALMLGAAMARHIALLVAVFDNNESAGLAFDRVDVEGDHRHTAKHLASYATANPHMPQTEMVGFTHRHAEDRYHLLASHHPTLVDPAMTREEVSAVYQTLARFYSLAVTDSGNTLVADNWLAMIQSTDQLVVPIVTSSDRDERARAMLATLDGFGDRYADLARNAIVVISTWRPGDARVARQYAARWEGKVRDVVTVPYDKHLGSHDLRFDSLRPATQAAYIRLAASVVRGLREAQE